MKPARIAWNIFSDWCAKHRTVVEVEMAVDLVQRIAAAITAERKVNANSPNSANHLGNETKNLKKTRA